MEVESGTVGGGIILSLVSTLFAEDRRKVSGGNNFCLR